VEILIPLIVIALIVVFVIGLYNRLITLRQRVREAWSDIDVQLKRRHDLIPNLVATVQGYAAHEKGVFENVTKARAAAVAGQNGTPQERAVAENQLAFARRFYNGNVRDYNTALQTVPTNILAGMFGFTPEQYFELADATEREVPKVSFG